MEQQEQDILEVGDRVALALNYSADVQYRLWRMRYDYRTTIYKHTFARAYTHVLGRGEGEGSGLSETDYEVNRHSRDGRQDGYL